jgi:SAM-dependent methyltransferase
LEFDFVHSSHTLEHMINPEISLRNWWRVLKRGGYLILYVPHRNLYEKKTTLPSRWNTDHKHFFLLDKDEEPCTIGIVPLIKRSISEFEIVYAKECSEGHTITNPQIHSNGEYSIEVVVKKK